MKIGQTGFNVLMDKAGDGTGAGGGGTGGSGDGAGKGGAPDLSKQFEELKTTNAALLARLEKLEGKKPDDKKDDDLTDKARQQREADDKKSNDTKALEDALRFEMGAPDWLKTNQSLLPKDIEDIFKAAKNEKYDSVVEKDAAIKSGIVKSFFSIQSNLDLLTPALKNQLEDYLKLTNTGRQEKARQVYETIFEPAFEMLKRVKRAEALQKGHGDGSDDVMIQKRIDRAKKHFLREKSQ